MKNPFFTIIVSTYNRNSLLQRAITSLLNQNDKDWECIIVDDGSQDDTYSYCIPLCKQDSRFYYVYQSNLGPAYARETGIKLANGRYVTFLDSDDEYEPEHLTLRKRLLIENPFIDFLFGGYKVIGSKFVPDIHNPNKLILLDKCVVGGTFFIKKSVINKLGGIPKLEYGEDAKLFEIAKRAGLIIKRVEFPTYIYHREHEISRTKGYF